MYFITCAAHSGCSFERVSSHNLHQKNEEIYSNAICMTQAPLLNSVVKSLYMNDSGTTASVPATSMLFMQS